MQKKVAIIILVIGTLLLVGGGLWFFKFRQVSSNIVSPSESTPNTSETPPEQPVGKLLTWNDPAGFTFQYPAEGGIKINKHDEDTTNYAHLDLFVDGKDGAVKIMASDTKYKTVKEWATQPPKTVQLAGGGVETVLGGKTARKVTFADTNQTIVAAIDEGIVFTIELSPDKEGFWQKTFDQVVSTFTFVYPTSAPSLPTNSSGSSSDVIEEEEIVE